MNNIKLLSKMIAICGFQRSGKDTVANYICDAYPYYKNVKISRHLKDTLKLLFNFNEEQLETDLKDIKDEYWDIEPRKVMQFIGTDLMQFEIQKLLPDINRNFWIKTFINKYLLNNDNKCKFVISDLRFIHEYNELKKYGFIFIRIENDNLINNSSHISEQEYLKINVDYIIKNNGSKDELKTNVDKIMTVIRNV